MKYTHSIMLAALVGLFAVTTLAQTPKSGITAFTVDGYDRSMNINSDNEPELYFIEEGSTTLKEGILVSDEIVKYTEQRLKAFLGYELVPVDLKRPAAVPAQMAGKLWVMETITDKKAFKQLNYDEVIEVQCRIGSAGKAGSNYKPFMEVFVKITNKDGKTVFKKREKVKIDEKIQASLIEMRDGNSGLSLSFGKQTNDGPQGITGAQLLDWYKQALDNLLIQ